MGKFLTQVKTIIFDNKVTFKQVRILIIKLIHPILFMSSKAIYCLTQKNMNFSKQASSQFKKRVEIIELGYSSEL